MDEQISKNQNNEYPSKYENSNSNNKRKSKSDILIVFILITGLFLGGIYLFINYDGELDFLKKITQKEKFETNNYLVGYIKDSYLKEDGEIFLKLGYNGPIVVELDLNKTSLVLNGKFCNLSKYHNINTNSEDRLLGGYKFSLLFKCDGEFKLNDMYFGDLEIFLRDIRNISSMPQNGKINILVK